jgi:transcriptional regulator GlxA family with amidase domain
MYGILPWSHRARQRAGRESRAAEGRSAEKTGCSKQNESSGFETSAEKRYSVAVSVRTSSRNFAVLLFDEVELLDVASVMQVASLAGRHYNWRPFRLLPVALQAGLVETRSQLRLEAKFSLDDCPAPEILFVPGGYGARRAASDARIVAWCRQASAGADLTLCIGSGAAVLGAAGVLSGASVATTNETRAWLASTLPTTRLDEPEPIVSSLGGKLLSASTSGHGVELALAMVERFLGRRITLNLRANLGNPNVSRLDLPDPVKITPSEG